MKALQALHGTIIYQMARENFRLSTAEDRAMAVFSIVLVLGAAFLKPSGGE